MSAEIYKATITVPVMGAAGSAEEFERRLKTMSLADILADADDGELISGGYDIVRVEHIHRDDVSTELQGVGNDGSFFDCDLDGEDDEDADGGRDGQHGNDGP